MKCVAKLLAAAVFSSASLAQQVSLTEIAGPGTQVHVLGNRPALHDGTVAFYGYRGSTYGQDQVVATAPSDGSGPFRILVQEGEPRPDPSVPGELFVGFGNPGIHAGRVVFLGVGSTGFASTYESTNGAPFSLYTSAAINDPFVGRNGVTSKATRGVSYQDNNGLLRFFGLENDPLPCGTGVFGRAQVPGLVSVPQSDHHMIWPTRVSTPEFAGDAVVAYDMQADALSCVVTGADTIPNFGGPFDFFLKADTDGSRAAFIGMDPTLGFGRHQGVYVRDLGGTGPIVLIADKLTPAPGGGSFGSFENVTIDGDLVLFEGCSGGQFGCARYGIYGCYVDNGVPGPLFEVITTAETIGGRPITDVTIKPSGRDGDQLALDLRHGANAASLYVATVQRLPAATGSVYNGSGVNPLCLAGEPAVIGQDWRAVIDTTVRAMPTLSGVFLYARSSSGTFLPGGELLVDIGSTSYSSVSAAAVGPTTTHVLAVPPDPALAGLGATAQGIVLGGGYTLCNAYSFLVGF